MDHPLIRKTPGVCGGNACIRDHRIPVWLLVEMKQDGISEASMLKDYPFLHVEDLQAAWQYHQSHPLEIEKCLWENEVCMVEHVGTVDPNLLWQGKRLGFSDEEIRESFWPSLSQELLNQTWALKSPLPQQPGNLGSVNAVVGS